MLHNTDRKATAHYSSEDTDNANNSAVYEIPVSTPNNRTAATKTQPSLHDYAEVGYAE